MNPTNNSSPYTNRVAAKGTRNADISTSISPAVMLPKSLKVKLMTLTNSLKASRGAYKREVQEPLERFQWLQPEQAGEPALKTPQPDELAKVWELYQPQARNSTNTNDTSANASGMFKSVPAGRSRCIVIVSSPNFQKPPSP